MKNGIADKPDGMHPSVATKNGAVQMISRDTLMQSYWDNAGKGFECEKVVERFSYRQRRLGLSRPRVDIEAGNMNESDPA